MRKRIFNAIMVMILCAVMLPCSIPVFAEQSEGKAAGMAKATEPADQWFQKQLDQDGLMFYHAMEKMYGQGLMKSGTGSIDMVKEGLTQDELDDYAKGDTTLAKAFQLARDAFVQDHCDIFYVDFSKLTFRIGKQNNSYVAYINNGTNQNYYAEGITSKEQVETILAQAKTVREEIKVGIDPKQNAAEIVKAVHNALIERNDYTYPDENNRYVNSIYGSLLKGKANCEGYSRAFQWIMEDFNIPCILVSGIGENSSKVKESHMWNYIQIEKQWYAVDVTWDDPIGAQSVQDSYLLRGADRMQTNHYPIGEFSYGLDEANRFQYPELNDLDYEVYQENKNESAVEDLSTALKIKTEKGTDSDNDDYTNFMISYEPEAGQKLDVKKTYEKLGLHVAARVVFTKEKQQAETTKLGRTEEAEAGDWFDLSMVNIFHDGEKSYFQVYSNCYVQFCVTELAPDKLANYSVDLTEEGRGESLTIPIRTPFYSNYVAPPFIRKMEPSMGKSILPQKQHFKLEYYERLVKTDDTKEPGMAVTTSQPNITYQFENLQVTDTTYVFDGKEKESTTIEFDFTPTKSYQGYINVYSLQLTNLVGKNSKKVPNSVRISTNYPMSVPCPAYVAEGTIPNVFVIAYPTLVVNEGMDIFEYEGGTANSMDIRLIASKPEKEEEQDFLDTLETAEQVSVKASSTYELLLNCRNLIARLKAGNGYHVTVGLPYPDGFNYEDNKNVEFKAYHYKKQADGTYVPEELVCRITPLGLEVIVNSFSPFTVAAIEKRTDAPEASYKTVSISDETAGGLVTTEIDGKTITASGLYSMTKTDGTKRFQIQAEEGYVIDQLYLNDQELSLEKDGTSYVQEFAFDMMPQESTLRVSFIAKSVQQKEEAEQIVPIIPTIKPIDKNPKSEVQMSDIQLSGFAGNTKVYDGKPAALTAVPKFNYNGYDGKDLLLTYRDKNGTVLKSAPKDAGDYTLSLAIPENNERYSGSAQISFTIQKRELLLTGKNVKLTAGKKLPSVFSYTVKGLVPGEKLTASPVFKVKGTVNTKKAGVYSITGTGAKASANYRIRYQSGKLTVAYQSYSITYKLNGGKNPSDVQKKYTYKTGTKLPVPVKKGYVFKGWFIKNGQKPVITVSKTEKGKKTYYAKWKKLPVGISIQSITGSQNKTSALRYRLKNKVDGVQVSYSTSKKFTKGTTTTMLIKGSKKTGFYTTVLKGTKPGATYYVKVRGYCMNYKNKKQYGSYGKTIRVTLHE